MNTTTSAATLRQSEGIPVGTTDRLSRTGSTGGAEYAAKRSVSYTHLTLPTSYGV